jgi:AhpD family alkylhydroperoxidase
MKPRLNYAKAAPGVYDAMDALDRYIQHCSLEQSLVHLVKLRASQLNGCAYCLDMHWKDLRALGRRSSGSTRWTRGGNHLTTRTVSGQPCPGPRL